MKSKMLSTNHACNSVYLVISEICFNLYFVNMYVMNTMYMENSSVNVVTGEQELGGDNNAHHLLSHH